MEAVKNNCSGKLPAGVKVGYAVGQVGVSVPYNLIIFYLLFFFTNVAGINPAFAGTIFLVAVLWAAVADPLIGIFSDNLRTKYGRRRPMLLAVGIPYALVTFLLFTAMHFSNDTSKSVYYVVLTILFYTAMTFTEVPFYSLGAEITTDFDERTSVRAISSIFVYVAVLVACNLPIWIVAATTNSGGTLQAGWSTAALASGVIALGCLLICWKATKGRELIVESAGVKSVERDKDIFKAIIETFKVKPIKFIVIANCLYLFGFSCLFGVKVYVLTYITHASALTQSLVLSVLPICTILWVPVINKLGQKFGKKQTYIMTLSLTIASLLVLFAIGNYSALSICILDVFFSLGNGTFWTLCFAMAYDTAEVDEFVNNKRREGILVSYMSFAQKIGTALSLWFTGFALQFVGYNGAAAIQSDKAISGLIALFTWVPAILILLSVISVAVYPITKKKHEALKKAIEQRKKGEPYDTSEFADLI